MAAIDLTSGTAGAYGSGELQLQGKVQMTSTLTPVTDNLNVASPLLLSTTLVQTTSTLKITTNDNPYIDAEDGAGNNRFTVGRSTSSQQVNVDFASNPGGSTTAVGAIRTYRDGVNLSEVMTFIEDGSVGIGTTAPVGILDLFKSAAATRLAIRGDAGQNRLISYRTGALQRFGLYVNNTAESGANAGSDFAIRAYSDAGTLLSTPFFIERSTGNVGINTTTPDSTFDSNGLVTISGGEALTLGLKALQLPTGIATNVISAGLSTRTGVAGESIVQFGNNLNTYYTGAVNAAKAGAMVRLDTRGVEPNINSSNYSVFQIQTRAAGVADPNYTVPVQIGAAPNGSFIIKTDGTSAFGGNVGIGTSTPTGFSDRILNIFGATGAEVHLTTNGSGTLNSDGFSLGIRDSDGSVQITQRDNSFMAFATNDTERVRITAAGNVGIGTSTPGSTLDVNGVVRVASYLEGASFPYSLFAGSGADATITTLRGGSTAGQACSVVVSGGGAATNPNSIVFNVASAERGRWTTDGLCFNGDTAAANALDDYEEGTWTMGLSFGGASTGITYTANTGTYTKIGRQVTVNGYLLLSSKGISTGNATITGLPFTIGNAVTYSSAASLWTRNISFLNMFQSIGTTNTTNITLWEVTTSGLLSSLDDVNFANDSDLIITFTYFV